MTDVDYSAKQAAVRKAAEEVTRALNTISDIFTSFQDDYLALLQDNENLRNLLKKPTPPSSRDFAKILRSSPPKKSPPPKCQKPRSPQVVHKMPSSPNTSSQEYSETPGIVETTQFPLKSKPTPLKARRPLQPKKNLFPGSASNSKNFDAWPSTSQQNSKNGQSQSRVLSLSKRNVSTRITSSGKIEKQTKLVLQPITTKSDMSLMGNEDNCENGQDRSGRELGNESLMDPQDLDIDATLFDKAFTQEDREVIESSPNGVNPRRKSRFRLKRETENANKQSPKLRPPVEDIVLSDFDDDLEPSLTQLEKEAVTQSKMKNKKSLENGKKRSKSPNLGENVDFGHTRRDMDETYFPRAENPLQERHAENSINTAKRNAPDAGPSGLQKPPEKVFDMDVDGDWDADVSMDKWTSPPKMMNSFDLVPRPKSPGFAFKGPVVRNKAERAKLKGWSCKDCQHYYENMNLTEQELQKRMDMCSRHRSKHNERYNTPPGFWNPVFEDTPASQQTIRE